MPGGPLRPTAGDIGGGGGAMSGRSKAWGTRAGTCARFGFDGDCFGVGSLTPLARVEEDCAIPASVIFRLAPVGDPELSELTELRVSSRSVSTLMGCRSGRSPGPRGGRPGGGGGGAPSSPAMCDGELGPCCEEACRLLSEGAFHPLPVEPMVSSKSVSTDICGPSGPPGPRGGLPGGGGGTGAAPESPVA